LKTSGGISFPFPYLQSFLSCSDYTRFTCTCQSVLISHSGSLFSLGTDLQERNGIDRLSCKKDLWEGVVACPARPRGARPRCLLAEYTSLRIAVKAHYIRLYGQKKNASTHASMMSAFFICPTSTPCLHCYSTLGAFLVITHIL